MEATKVFTSQYLQELISNQLRNKQPLKCPEGCNPKQYAKMTQIVLNETKKQE